MTALTDKQVNQLRYELKRRFLTNVNYHLDRAIEQVTNKEVKLCDVVTVTLQLRTMVTSEIEDGVIQLEKV